MLRRLLLPWGALDRLLWKATLQTLPRRTSALGTLYGERSWEAPRSDWSRGKTMTPRLWIVRGNDHRRLLQCEAFDDDCEVFDRVAFLRSIDGNLRLFRELAERFVSDCGHRLAVVDDALERQDSEALEGIAHSIRGSAAYLQAPGVYRAALTLETRARARDFTQMREACADLLHEVARLVWVLSRHLSRKSRPALEHEGSALRMVRP